MSSRLDLHNEFLKLCKNVYWQPPTSHKMEYPCIVYERVRINTEFADNKPYMHNRIYQVTYIDVDPDSEVPLKLADFPQCVFERQYKANEMYHNVYRLTY